MKELKHCPFCGGEAEVKFSKGNGFQEVYWVLCKQKSCQGRAKKAFGSKEQAIVSWNKRDKGLLIEVE